MQTFFLENLVFFSNFCTLKDTLDEILKVFVFVVLDSKTNKVGFADLLLPTKVK